jgi:hypothetical protein
MTPPEQNSETDKSDDRSRTYSKDKTKSSIRRQQLASSHDSPYWDSYGYGQKETYPYGYTHKEYETPTYEREREAGYIRSEYYPDYRQSGSGWGCEPSYSAPQQPGYKRALMDPSLALGIMVAGAIATYVLYTAIPTAIPGRKRSAKVIDSPETFEDWFWSGKK